MKSLTSKGACLMIRWARILKDRQSPIAGVQRTQSPLASHSAISRAMNGYMNERQLRDSFKSQCNSGVHGTLWKRVLDQLGPSWSEVAFPRGKTQQNDSQLVQVGPTWPSWEKVCPSWSRTPHRMSNGINSYGLTGSDVEQSVIAMHLLFII